MHDSARRGLLRLLAGAGALLFVVVAVVLLMRGCKSEAERVSEAVDAARDALVERRPDDFLAFFAPEVRYHVKKDRKALEKDVAQWVEARVGRVSILERKITVDGTSAQIHLRCEAGMIFGDGMPVAVDLEAENRDGTWQVVSFDWKRE